MPIVVSSTFHVGAGGSVYLSLYTSINGWSRLGSMTMMIMPNTTDSTIPKMILE
jgi:hypothetical protein